MPSTLQKDTGHLTYARPQSTLNSNNLHLLRNDYDDAAIELYTDTLSHYITAEKGLGIGIIYDSKIHSGWHRIRDRTNDLYIQLGRIDENQWFTHYVAT